MTNFQREQLQEEDTTVLRVVIDQWFNQGSTHHSAFMLMSEDKKDNNRLSVNQARLGSPEQAYKQKAETLRARKEASGSPYTPPAGVAKLTVGEISAVKVSDPSHADAEPRTGVLTVWDDSMNDDRPDDHAHIDYNAVPPHDKGAVTAVAKQLAARVDTKGLICFT